MGVMSVTLAFPPIASLVPLAKELDESKVTPGLLGFGIFLLIGAAVGLLVRNMNKQIKKIDFDDDSPVP